MTENFWRLIEDIVLVYFPVVLVLILFLALFNHSFKPLLIVAYFVYVFCFVLVTSCILFEDLLNKNFEETEKI